ncbi:Rha family transcriptional regulator [uncultured Desulfovibrio sp.]|uniref:Rha family transcriptional regulator n=1 Tax=uncultured Desulfovibrio sp. TaxID=167968 RepID=UPI00263B3344|nr:Rha family transcriptional regulator [uncultured Desulfovibrio sp.]
MSQLFTSSAPDIRFHTLGVAPAVLSTEVARHFQRRHSHILREIDRLRSILPKSFCEPNFGLTSNDVPGPNGGIRQEKAYLLSRDALSLLVMGMTGKAAILWKLRYIEAFNAMEAALREQRPHAEPPAALEGRLRASYLDGLREGRRLAARADRLRLLERALRYRRLGLTNRDIARLLGIAHQRVSDLFAHGRRLGIATPAMKEACHA